MGWVRIDINIKPSLILRIEVFKPSREQFPGVRVEECHWSFTKTGVAVFQKLRRSHGATAREMGYGFTRALEYSVM